MKQLTKKVKRNYMDCDWFLKSNKIFFLCFLFFVLAGAMEFNSISDIPAMAMVLLLLSFYAFRREYFLAYGRFVMFMAYYVQFAVTVKIFWTLLMVVPEVHSWFGHHQKNPAVRVSMLLFGIEESSGRQDAADVSSTQSQKSKVLQVFFMLMVLYSVQCWKQQRWTAIRYQTAQLGSSLGAYSRFIWSLRHREKVKSEMALIDQMRKDKEKERKAKAIKKKTGGPKMKKRQKSGVFTRLRKHLNRFLPSLVVWVMRILLTF